MSLHPIYPTADLLATELKNSIHASRLIALRNSKKAQDREHLITKLQLEHLLARINSVIALLENE